MMQFIEKYSDILKIICQYNNFAKAKFCIRYNANINIYFPKTNEISLAVTTCLENQLTSFVNIMYINKIIIVLLQLLDINKLIV